MDICISDGCLSFSVVNLTEGIRILETKVKNSINTSLRHRLSLRPSTWWLPVRSMQ